VILQTYTGETLSIFRSIEVTAMCNNQTNRVPLLVIKVNGPNLMGRDWLAKFKLDQQNIYRLNLANKINKLLIKI